MKLLVQSLCYGGVLGWRLACSRFNGWRTGQINPQGRRRLNLRGRLAITGDGGGGYGGFGARLRRGRDMAIRHWQRDYPKATGSS